MEVNMTKLHLELTFPENWRDKCFIIKYGNKQTNKIKIKNYDSNHLLTADRDIKERLVFQPAVSAESQGYSCYRTTTTPRDPPGSGLPLPLHQVVGLKPICHTCQLQTVSQKVPETFMWITESLITCP